MLELNVPDKFKQLFILKLFNFTKEQADSQYKIVKELSGEEFTSVLKDSRTA